MEEIDINKVFKLLDVLKDSGVINLDYAALSICEIIYNGNKLKSKQTITEWFKQNEN